MMFEKSLMLWLFSVIQDLRLERFQYLTREKLLGPVDDLEYAAFIPYFAMLNCKRTANSGGENPTCNGLLVTSSYGNSL